MGDWLDKKCSQPKQKAVVPGDKRLSWFVILIVIGIGVINAQKQKLKKLKQRKRN